MYQFFFKLFSHLGYYRVLSRVPCGLFLNFEGSLAFLILFIPLLLKSLSMTSGFSDSGWFRGTDSPSWKPLPACRHQTKWTIWKGLVHLCLGQNEHDLNLQLETRVGLGVFKPGTNLWLFEINCKERKRGFILFMSLFVKHKFLGDGEITRFSPLSLGVRGSLRRVRIRI